MKNENFSQQVVEDSIPVGHPKTAEVQKRKMTSQGNRLSNRTSNRNFEPQQFFMNQSNPIDKQVYKNKPINVLIGAKRNILDEHLAQPDITKAVMRDMK